MLSNRIRTLLIMLGAAAVVGGSEPTHAMDAAKMLAVDPQSLKWTPIPDMPSCASAAILNGNPRTGPAWVLLKLGSGCRVPLHWHTANEYLVSISGRGTMTMKDGPSLQLAPGAYASLPSHHMHQTSCAHACLFFSIGDAAFDIHYVGANGEEIPLDQAMKQAVKPAVRKKTKKTKK